MKRDAGEKQGFEQSRMRAEKEFTFMKDNADQILQSIRGKMTDRH